ALVNGADLDVGREIVGVGKHEAGEEFVFFEVAGKDDELWAEATGHDGGHGRVNAKLASFVGGRGDDAAFFAADGNGVAAKAGVGGLLDGGEEGVGVEVNNRAEGKGEV